ncbi:hypothetical protein RhiirB3_454080 [Rhizophagus irregularis]|nr:hypothetical protein RhiirB3_454080 [Rhizophagus irregularis]
MGISSGNRPFLNYSQNVLAIHICYINLGENQLMVRPKNINNFVKNVWMTNLIQRPDIEEWQAMLSNILCDVDNSSVCIYINSEANNFQEKGFEWNGTKYRVRFDAGRINSSLFVVDGKFTAEEISMFELFEDVI